MKILEVLKSQQDESVNFVFKGDFPGYFEARYVRRRPDYFIVYLSAQSGCRQACSFCHLTATKQTSLVDADLEILSRQADAVLDYYDSKNKAQKVHFSFMARGESLANRHLTKKGDYSILEALGKKALERGLFPRFTISTILPKTLPSKDLTQLFPLIYPDLYYSIYSLDPVFRKKWLPNALPAEEGLDILTNYQEKTRKIPKLHWAFIKDENDSIETLEAVCKAVNDRKLRVDVNLVRYNPFSDKHGEEPSLEIIQRNYQLLRDLLPPESKIKVVDRVGFDVSASCGCFVAPRK